MGRNDILRTIKDAEAAAEETVRSAKDKAAKILSEARVSASDALNTGKKDADSSAQAAIQTARDAAAGDAFSTRCEAPCAAR